MTEHLYGPAYRIETKRLVLRCPEPRDAQALSSSVAENIEHLSPWMPWAKDPNDLNSVMGRLRRFRGRFDLGQDYMYLILSPDEQRVLGSSGLHTRLGEGALEIGYWIHKDFINQGLASETSAALTRVAFEIHHVHRVEIHCAPDNVRSAAVPRKLGYAHEATLRERVELPNGSWRDSMVWTLLAQDYPTTPCASQEIKAFDAIGRRLI